MPILLTTPLDLGALGADQTHVKIQSFTFDVAGASMLIECWHGTMSGSIFTPCSYEGVITHKAFEITGAALTALIAILTEAANIPVYDEAARVLYEWLINNDHYDGTIV